MGVYFFHSKYFSKLCIHNISKVLFLFHQFPDLPVCLGVLNQRVPLDEGGGGHLPALQTQCTCLTLYNVIF